MYYFYIVRCSDNSLYCGQTNNLKTRIKEHNSSKVRGARYTRIRKPVKLVYSEKYKTLQGAMKREWQIKKWTKAKKEALVHGHLKLIKKILNHFKKKDPILYFYALKINQLEPIKKDRPENYFLRLCKEIICQQLSNKAGDVIFGRFQKLFPNDFVQPLDILSISHERLRASGMSNAKAHYVRNLAEEIIHGTSQIYHLDVMSDEEIIKELTRIKGIGRWTAEMFLIFTLGRENIFSFGDLGLKKGIIKIYNLKREPLKKQIEKIISKWSPYKSYASRVLWASLDLAN